jgi:hypothetical protein
MDRREDDRRQRAEIVSIEGTAKPHTRMAIHYVSQSLAELYLEMSRVVKADRWLTRMRSHLSNQDTLNDREYDRLRTGCRPEQPL